MNGQGKISAFFLVKPPAPPARVPLPLKTPLITIENDSDTTATKKARSKAQQVPVGAKLWSDKYRPEYLHDFIGDERSFLGLKIWLSTWSNKFDKNYDDDTDIPDGKSLFISGLNGVGKTSLVYAIANECGYKVLEYNSSFLKLTHSVLQKELLESSQSHCIGSNKAPIPSIFQPKGNVVKKLGSGKPPKFRMRVSPKEKKKESPKRKPIEEPVLSPLLSQNAGISKSLILFDDIDAILFDERSDLWKTIRNTIRDARKPIIFTSCFALSFLTSEDDIFYKFHLPRIQTEDIYQKVNKVMMAEHRLSKPTSKKSKVWTYAPQYDGDIRRTLNFMQFWSKDEIHRKDVILKHKQTSLGVHARMIDLLSMENCYEDTQQSMANNIDEHICDYTVCGYHSIPSLTDAFEEKHSSFLTDLRTCVHQAHIQDRFYRGYNYDVKFFFTLT